MRIPFLLVLAAALAPQDDFLDRLQAPGPTSDTRLVRTQPSQNSVASYDVALATLRALERGRREEAQQLLLGMVALQQEDGVLPFSFRPPRPDPARVYVRTGAMAWLGYAAVRFLEGGDHEDVAGMTRRLADYMLAHRIIRPGDGRDGLVTGGDGRFRYEITADDQVKETFEAEPITWVSAEHNIDTYFFLRAYAAQSGQQRYREVADELGRALIDRLWSEQDGQFWQGCGESADPTLALDCAAWGAIFLNALGDKARAEKAYTSAEMRYRAVDPNSFAFGHRPYFNRAVIENRALADHFQKLVPANLNSWDKFPAVWPEGSAGVALAALRLGHKARAAEILHDLERMRHADGGLPGLTRTIPLEFDQESALAGTAWAALVRSELEATPGWVGIWR